MALRTQLRPAPLSSMYMVNSVWKGCLALFFVLSLASLLSSSSNGSGQYQIDRTLGQGKMWLRWTRPERQRFVLGYLWAYHSGFSSGCVTCFESSSTQISTNVETSPLQKCKLQELTYSKDAAYYENEITKYYRANPADYDLPLSWLMQAFSDSENKSPAEIHAAWMRGHSHP